MIKNPLHVILVALGMGVPSAHAVVIFSADFNANDGGFTVNTPQAYDGPWTYRAGTGSWGEDGQAPENSRPNTSMLNSPLIAIAAAGAVTMNFDHRYSFEEGFWDGGQVRISVNGGAYTTVPGAAFLQNGYNGSVLSNSASVLAGQPAFVETSSGFGSGFITTMVDLGSFAAGDMISVQFIVGNDTNTRGPNLPNWEIDSVTLNGPGPSPVPEFTGTLTLLSLGLAGLVVIRRVG